MSAGVDPSRFSPEKRKLLEQLLRKKGIARQAGASGIPKRDGADPARHAKADGPADAAPDAHPQRHTARGAPTDAVDRAPDAEP